MVSPVDKAKTARLFQDFRKAVEVLKTLKETPEPEFLANIEKQGAAKYFFIVAIESAIDICNHIIAEHRWGQPTEYAEVFRVMGEAGVFPLPLVAELELMAKFRNLLVHVYGQVDDRRVYQILQTRLTDFDQLEACLQSYLRAQEADAGDDVTM